MSGGRAGGIIKRLVAFLRDPVSWVVTAVAAAGLFLAFQAKLPADLEQFAAPGSDGFKVDYRLPIASYGGPVLIELEHGPAAAGARLIISAANKQVTELFLPAERGGDKRFLLYPGTLAGGGGLTIKLVAPVDNNLEQLISKAVVRFPKAGYWLIPDPTVWMALLVLVVLLGAAAAVIWPLRSLQRACFITFAVLAVLTVHFIGIGFAVRLAWLTPAALILLIIAVIFKLVVPEQS
ncbi:MAG TPA: hypothetical protein VMX35_02960 [Acidobacteriota bacterium]|nr:hypothetical protein [Acidobacteriota bacterium]